jgi:uncharacterized membrane protein HdeD (DUF308 family)
VSTRSSAKQKWQLGCGVLSAATGIALFVYFGTRTRPSGAETDPRIHEQALLHDVATLAGLGLLFLGLVLLLLAAAGRWNEAHRQDDERSGR